MIPAGYLYKKIMPKQEEFQTVSPVKEICSITECMVKTHPVHWSTRSNVCHMVNSQRSTHTLQSVISKPWI